MAQWAALIESEARAWILSAVDIAIVSYVIYRFFLLIRGTRAVQLIKGLAVLFIAAAVSRWLELRTIYWLLDKAQVGLLVALPIVFQPELRRALEHVGRGRLFATNPFAPAEDDPSVWLDEVVRAVLSLSRRRHGAILVFERETGLKDLVETGIKLDALISAEALVNIFVPNTPLHDGAVILRGNRIVAAACFLPLAESQDLGIEYGSRHRAALGVTEHSDALALVVSEETGGISLARQGKMVRNLEEEGLRELLGSLLLSQDVSRVAAFWPRRRPV